MRYFKGEYLTLAVAAVMLAGCSKSDDDTDDTGNWSKRFVFEGQTRIYATSFVIGDSVYVGTGYQPGVSDATARFRDLFVYDPVTDNWSMRAAMPADAIPRSGAVGMAIGGKGYIGTGAYAAGYDKVMNDFWEYDPKTNSWAKKASFRGSARQGAVAFSLKNKGYIATGRDAGGWLYDCWSYTPGSSPQDSGRWDQVSNVPKSKKWHAAVFVIGDNAYVAGGGNDGTSDLDELSVFDGTTWKSMKPTRNSSDDSYDDEYTDITRSNAIAFTMNNKGYLATGTSGSSSLSSVWEYDAVNDQWTKKHDFEGGARYGAVGFTVKGRGYLVTGGNSGAGKEDTWEYHPDAEYDETDDY